MIFYDVHLHVSVSVRAGGAQRDWDPRCAGWGAHRAMPAPRKTNSPPLKIHAHRFPDTAEMLSPAHREIDGVFGLPVAFRGGECVYVI